VFTMPGPLGQECGKKGKRAEALFPLRHSSLV
jgi:hypothetical protein